MDNTTVGGGQTLEQKITSYLELKPVIYQFMRFACIGLLNTALNFLILNTLSKAMGISQGWRFGAVEAIAFVFALVQSYLWNRTWTFGGEQGVSLWRNITRLFWVGVLGGLTIVLVFVASKFSAPALFYLVLLIIYLILEGVVWNLFGFHISNFNHEGHSFVAFSVVTLIGLGINVSLVSVISTYLHITNSDLDKNLAAALATGVSLFWNFIGYKVIVFKK